MQNLLVLVRIFHYASFISLAGTLVFAAFIAEPAFRRNALAIERIQAYRNSLFRILWLSLGIGLASGFLWLVIEAVNMSGRTLAEVFSQGLLGTVLARTQFGRDWAWRGLLVLPLILCLALARRRHRSFAGRAGFWSALPLSVALLVMIAGAGHAAAGGPGWAGWLHLCGDGFHLLGVGSWLGGLLPLALLFGAARRDGGTSWALAARDATVRYSTLGVLAVGTIVVTGLINVSFLVGTIPGLVGTEYGHLLLTKISLFLVMVTFAAYNRFRLVPRIAQARMESGAAAGWDAIRILRRNTLVEVLFGITVVTVVGRLGTTPPALHVQPVWPFPYALSLTPLMAAPELRAQAIVTGGLALLGLGSAVYGILRAHRHWVRILAGLLLFLGAGSWPLQLLVVKANPTSFYRSSVPLTVQSVVHGSETYAENCAACHGSGGRGDGPLARTLPVAPPDLTAAHLLGHTDGDFFWWISHGFPESGMPGFGAGIGNDKIGEQRIWELIDFVRARIAGAIAEEMGAEVTDSPAFPAPDFIFDTQDGTQASLASRRAKGPVLLVFYTAPASLPRLDQLGSWHDDLAALGVSVLAVPATAEKETNLSDFAVAVSDEVRKTYALFVPHPAAEPAPRITNPIEFLIDENGYIRARWQPGERPDWSRIDEFRKQIETLARFPLAPVSHGGHAHG